MSLTGGFLAVRMVGNGVRALSEVGSQGREMEPKGASCLWGKGQGKSSTVLFMPVLHTLLCMISLMFLVLCPSLSGFEIQEVGVDPTKSRPYPSYPFPLGTPPLARCQGMIGFVYCLRTSCCLSAQA